MALAEIAKEERPQIIAALVRKHGMDIALSAVDAAFLAAVEAWPPYPDRPGAWLYRVASRRAIDEVRRRRQADTALAALEPLSTEEAPEADPIPDERLKLLFTCAHPAIAEEARVALALRWISGLSTEAVARAFCVPVSTMAQRLTRAKAKIEAAGIPYEVPEKRELEARVDSVLEMIYAIFNEGYVATSGDALMRVDLAQEAIFLAKLTADLLPESAKAKGLLALCLLTHARRDARTGADGSIVRLEHQDRRLFRRDEIAEGALTLKRALELGRPNVFSVEAAIAALHAEAPSYAETDFAQIAELYAVLHALAPTPAVRINQIVAEGRVHGAERALSLLDAPEFAEETGPAYFAARASFLLELGDRGGARDAFCRARSATRNAQEQRFFDEELRLLDSSP